MNQCFDDCYCVLFCDTTFGLCQTICYFRGERQFCESGDSRDNIPSALLNCISKPLPKQSDIYFVELESKREHDHTVLQPSNTLWGKIQITSLLWKVLLIHTSLIGSERVERCVSMCVFILIYFVFFSCSTWFIFVSSKLASEKSSHTVPQPFTTLRSLPPNLIHSWQLWGTLHQQGPWTREWMTTPTVCEHQTKTTPSIHQEEIKGHRA